MQKIIKLETENTSLERWTENSACEIYSHDTNNGHFEIEVMNEALTDESVTALFIFEESQSVWRTNGTIEENKIKFKFDTTLITQDETVICVLYLDNERENNDFYRFNFKVKVSEIDKLDNLTIKERLFKNNLIIDRLEVVTKDELKEALKNLDLSSISTEGLLTEEKANGLYAKISELEAVESKIITQEQLTSTKNEVVTEINNRLENYALKTNIPEPYNDTSLVSRVSDLERKTDKDTIYDDTSVRERLTVLENKPVVDTSVFVTEEKLSNYALKSELPIPYNDKPLTERVTALESKAIEGGAYDDSDLRNRVTNLESIDTSKFVTDEKLESKGYLKSHQDITGLATKEELANLVTNDQLESKHYITGAALENYALKSDIPQGYNDTEVKERLTVLENKQDKDTVYNDTELRTRVSELEQRPIATPYNDTALSDRVSALESKQDNDTVYNDSELRQRVETLENKPPIDTSKFITEEVLESKNYLTTPYNDIPLKGRIEVLENKIDKDTVYNDEPIKERLTALESKPNIDLTGYATKEELKAKVNTSDYDTFKGMVVTKGYLDSKNYLTEQYNDKPLTDRVVALENKRDNDTIYDDSELKRRVTTLETKTENLVTKEELHEATEIDYSNIITNDELEAKHYVTADELNNKGFLTQHQDISNLATKEEIKKFVTHEELPQPYNDTNLSNRVTALENKTDKDTIYNDTELRNRVSTLESRPTAKNGIRNALVIGWQDIYIQNMRFTSQMNLVDVVNNVTLRNINGLDIRRVNNATYGYVIFNNKTKQFTLEILETDLSKKTSDDYLITVMWNNGYYTDNGALKNNKR